MKKPLAALAALALLVAAAAWAWRIRAITHPRYETQTVETRTLKARYPAQWEKIDTANPRLGDAMIVFTNHSQQAEAYPGISPWDAPRMHLNLNDLGTGYVSVDAVAKEFLQGENATIADLRLDNGVTAKTWSTVEPVSPDIPAEFRHIVFAGPNRRFYDASYMVPANWKRRRRYEFIFERILGSIEFKPWERRLDK
ncbi:MAG: hypothetical protein HY077_14565 [Elusimicrobia bacterium]|nr:hypothetical protein [Elusimicrobiota bacterium]